MYGCPLDLDLRSVVAESSPFLIHDTRIRAVSRLSTSIDLSPYWRICAPGDELGDGPPVIIIEPGVGFGLGDHPSTQLCLLALGSFFKTGRPPKRVLDFGSGTGILSIAAAKNGGTVEAVEIDPQANREAAVNARLNGVAGRITFLEALSEPPPTFDLVVANILCPVLLQAAKELCQRLSPRGQMLLSGLTTTDVPSILVRFEPLLRDLEAAVFERGQWRAILFSPKE